MIKKKRKLLIQVSLIILPLFALLLVASVFGVYNSSIEAYEDARESHVRMILDQASYVFGPQSIPDLDMLFVEWEKNPLDMRIKPQEETLNVYYAYMQEIDIDSSLGSFEWLATLPEDIARTYVNMQYYATRIDIDQLIEKSDCNEIIVLDITGENCGMVLFDSSMDYEMKKIGDYFEHSLSEQKVFKELETAEPGDVLFRKSNGFPREGEYNIAYRPVMINDKAEFAIGLVYEWEFFLKGATANARKAVWIVVGFTVVIMFALLFFLYRIAIKPVSEIQSSLRDYISDKDSDKIISKLGRVKAKNEFGRLADNTAELISTITRYNDENIHLAQERERVATELDTARQIQASQLPSIFPAFPDRKEFDIYASMIPAKEVGGDFYDFFTVDEDHLALVMADVSGKGVPAALFMMMCKSLISNYTAMGLSPKEVIEKTNLTICSNNDQMMFVTVWFGILEISTGRVTAVNAGHEYPVIGKPDGSFELFEDTHCSMVGTMPSRKYKEYEFTLEKGGTLFLYTDGIPEATDGKGEMFGTERLLDTLEAHAFEKIEDMLSAVKNAVNDFVGEAPQFDDLTMLGIKLN